MAHKIVRTSNGHPALTARRWHDDRAVALRRVNNFQTYHYLLVSFQYLSSGDVSNTTIQCDSIWSNHGRIQRGGAGGPDPLPLESHNNIIFSNIDPGPVENLKATHVPSQHYMTGHHWSASETPLK